MRRLHSLPEWFGSMLGEDGFDAVPTLAVRHAAGDGIDVDAVLNAVLRHSRLGPADHSRYRCVADRGKRLAATVRPARDIADPAALAALDHVLSGDVDLHCDGGRADLLFRLARLRDVDTRKGAARPFRGTSLGKDTPGAARGAGDHCGLAVEPFHCIRSPLASNL